MKKYWQTAWRHKIILVILIVGLGLLAGYVIYGHKYQVLPQAAIHFLDDVQLPEKGQKVLIFSPHPDDESIAAAGYIFDSTRKGAEVKIVLVTDGNKHGLKDRRYDEFRQATSILGVSQENLIFLNYPDGHLKEANQTELAANFQKIIADFSPNIILYPSARDRHPDHATCGKVLETVLKQEKSSVLTYAYLVHSRHWPQPKKMAPSLYLLPPTRLINFDDSWQILMLDSSTLSKKKEAIVAYKSQLQIPMLRSLILSSVRENELFTIEKGT